MAHIWIKNEALLNAPEPKYRMLGHVRRRKSNASLVSDFIALRKTLFLCATCVWRMPWRWKKNFEYRKLPNFHADFSRCDSCQQLGSGDLFLPEESGYMGQYDHFAKTHNNAREQQITIRDGRRIKGI